MSDSNALPVEVVVDDLSSREASTSTQIRLVKNLKTFDHKILSPSVVQEYAAAFCVSLSCHAHDKKYCNDPEGDTMGLGAHVVAERLCRHLGVAYVWKHGIGSALYECCTKLEAHLQAKRSIQ